MKEHESSVGEKSKKLQDQFLILLHFGHALITLQHPIRAILYSASGSDIPFLEPWPSFGKLAHRCTMVLLSLTHFSSSWSTKIPTMVEIAVGRSTCLANRWQSDKGLGR